MKTTWVVIGLVAALLVGMSAGASAGRSKNGMGFTIQNEFAKLIVGNDGTSMSLIDKASGKDYCDHKSGTHFAQIKKAGVLYDVSKASYADGKITLDFGDAGIQAIIKIEPKKNYFVLDVLSLTGDGVEEMTFGNMNLTLSGGSSEPFACCSMALNLKTNVPEIPGRNSRLRATCYPRFGFAGASAAIVACPADKMRSIMQQVITNTPELPKSSLGGPWALDAESPRGSYLFNFGGLSESTVDDWIKLVKSMGLTEIEFHGGSSFRFGDCRPNPETYPRGVASFKAVIDKLHAAGIQAGLHTYSFLIDKSCPWITPKPDPRLAKDATFTLADNLSADASLVPVVESTEKMSTITGFFESNSITICVDDELINYSGISKTPPYAFTNCTRGAFGTAAASHSKGAKAYHLKERYGLFAPDGDSTLLSELAQKTADFYNECGFDAIYFDALDGHDVLGGPENGWHYGSLFVFDVFKRLKRPAMIEMACFHHHLWYVRSRVGAMDYPTRAQKRFIDLHCHGIPGHIHAVGNSNASRMFLPAELGWWSVHTAGDTQVERTFPDDIEYLMCRGLATNTGFAFIGINPQTIKDVPAFSSLAQIIKNYEDLRHAGYFPESVRNQLDKPGAEFTLGKDAQDKWQLYPVQYAKHKVTGSDGPDAKWTFNNKMGKQPAKIRIEALMSAASYDSPDAVTIADFSSPEEFSDKACETGISADLKASTDKVRSEGSSGCFTALSTRPEPNGSWIKVAKPFSDPINLADKQAMGIWVYGDGKGELLNIQVTSPHHIATGIADHFIDVNFTGWRYFELVEPDSGRVQDYIWPYIYEIYDIYRERVDYAHIAALSMYYNNLPKDKQVQCYLSPIKALPLVKAKLKNPKITINGKTITFPVEIESGCYLEFKSASDCKVYGPTGALIANVKPIGDVPELVVGENHAEFICDMTPEVKARANVTVISRANTPLK